VIYVAESFGGDTSPIATLAKGLKRYMAAEYSQEKGRLTRVAQARSVAQGFHHGAAPPFGLKRVLVTLDGTILQDLRRGEWKRLGNQRVKLAPGRRADARIVRRVFRWYADDGLSRAAIARRMNAAGVPRANGGPWMGYHITNMLSNEAYAGCAVMRLRDGANQHATRPADLHDQAATLVRCEHAWSAIIGPALWQRAVARLKLDTWRRMNRDLERQLLAMGEDVHRVARPSTAAPPADVRAHQESITTEVAALREHLARTIDLTIEDGSTWVVGGCTRVGISVSFPRRRSGGLHWRFALPTADVDAIVGVGLTDPPNVRVMELHCFVGRTLRHRYVYPALSAAVPQRMHKPITVPALSRRLRRIVPWQRITDEFIAHARSMVLTDLATLAQHFHWSRARTTYVYRCLLRQGHWMPPTCCKKGRRVGVTCPACGVRRDMPLSHALRLKSATCGACRGNERRSVRVRVVCSCGKTREYHPSMFVNLSAGAATPCHACTLAAGRARTLAANHEKRALRARQRDALLAVTKHLAALLAKAGRCFHPQVRKMGRSDASTFIYWSDPASAELCRLRIIAAPPWPSAPLDVHAAAERAADQHAWRAVPPARKAVRAWEVTLQ